MLKFRRRREKAQRRLDATEGNLLRLQDLLREVRRQLRPLERQADAARRHGALVDELGALRLHLAGRELASLQARAESGARATADLATGEGSLKTTLARLDADVMGSEAALSARGADDLSDSLVRSESLRERARGLAAVLAERARGVERDRRSFVDQAVIASLEADAARLRAELEAVEAEAARLMPRADELAEAESGLAGERAAFEEQYGDGMPLTGASAAAEVRGELGALRVSADRGATEVQRLEERLSALTRKDQRLVSEADVRRDAIGEATDAEAPLADAAAAAEQRRSRAGAEEADADAALRAIEAEFSAWSARAEALALALDEARARAGAERLAEVDGVVGTLLDLIDVDPGFEAAFEAAAGEAIAAVVVADVDAARRALVGLHAGEAAGAVIALDLGPSGPLSGTMGPSGPLSGTMGPSGPLSGIAGPGPTAGGERVRDHVRSARADVEDLLDRLLASAVVVPDGWEAALELSLAHPDLTVVTPSGDRFALAGWRAGSAGTGATGAALEEARNRAADAARLVAEATERRREARQELAEARANEADLLKQLDENDSRMTAATDALQRIESERRDTHTESQALRDHLAELGERVGREQARVAELDGLLPALEAEELAGVERVAALQAARGRLDERSAAVAALRSDLEVRAASIEERRTYVGHRLTEVSERLERNEVKRDEAERGRTALERRAIATDRLAHLVAARCAELETQLGRLREQRRQQSEQTRAISERLDVARRDRMAAERQLGELRERAQRAQIDGAEIRMRIEAATEALRRDSDCEPDTAMKAECPPLPAATSAAQRVRELERELRLMGPINPLALEEFTALQDRHEFLEAQLEDVKNGRRELSKVIKAVDLEIVDVFSAAYADVAENFTALFATLFPGGTGRLKLIDPNNLLDTGIEVEARPSGKNVRKLSLLSGGERSLTALAFLFAVFRSRPSPFYLMDEVEAALDDVNLHRFLDLIHEFRQEAQLVIVSHQKRTMEAADCLYGVTMQPGGSSKVISEKVAAGA